MLRFNRLCHSGLGRPLTLIALTLPLYWLVAAENLREHGLAADTGNPDAEFEAGRAYLRGDQRPQDYKQAADLFMRAADKGQVKAMHNLAMLYLEGKGVQTDPNKARRLLEKAAEHGATLSQVMLAKLLLEGKTFPQDEREGVGMLKMAAEQGAPEAEYMIGIAYNTGDHGLARNPGQAFAFLERAAQHGFVEANNALGVMYAIGSGCERNPKKAAELYRMAAEKGSAKAQANLGRLYITGSVGVPKDLVQAYVWLKRSADQGEVTGQNTLEEIQPLLRPEQVIEAKRIVSHPQQSTAQSAQKF